MVAILMLSRYESSAVGVEAATTIIIHEVSHYSFRD